MNHQPFEEWLLADKPPTGEQADELREHLDMCPHCRQLETSWTEVNQLFRTAGEIAPTPGFTSRWQTHQLEQQLARNRRNHRQPWLLLTFTLLIAAVLLGVLGFQLWEAFHSTAQMLLVKAFFLSLALSAVDTAQDILSAFIQVAIRFPIVQWAFLLGLSGFLGMFWITVGRQLVSIRRVTL